MTAPTRPTGIVNPSFQMIDTGFLDPSVWKQNSAADGSPPWDAPSAVATSCSSHPSSISVSSFSRSQKGSSGSAPARCRRLPKPTFTSEGTRRHAVNPPVPEDHGPRVADAVEQPRSFRSTIDRADVCFRGSAPAPYRSGRVGLNAATKRIETHADSGSRRSRKINETTGKKHEREVEPAASVAAEALENDWMQRKARDAAPC